MVHGSDQIQPVPYFGKILLELSKHLFIHCLRLLSYYNSKKTIWPTKPNVY